MYKISNAARRLAFVAAVGVTGCGTDERVYLPDEVVSDTGSMDLSLSLAEGIVIHTVDYAITGPRFEKSGSVPVEDSENLAFRIGGIPEGAGYRVRVTATTLEGAQCSGTAGFGVEAGSVTSVTLKLRCTEQPTSGSIQVNGTFNTCPVLDALSAIPNSVTVGGSVALTAMAHDADAAPAALAYAWSTSAGALSSESTPETRLTCTEAGVSRVTLTVDDGDCEESAVVEIECTQACPVDDGIPCTHEICLDDGTTQSIASEWPGCESANEAISESCGQTTFGEAQAPALELCGEELAYALAGSEGFDVADRAWQRFDACVDEVIGCAQDAAPQDAGAQDAGAQDAGAQDAGAQDSAVEEPALGRLDAIKSARRLNPLQLGVINSNICQQTLFLQCRDRARRKLNRDMKVCLAISLVTAAAATPAAGVLLFKGCTLKAVADEIFSVVDCANDSSCTSSQACVNETCVDKAIEVVSATYGGNCGVGAGNVTGSVAGQCDGQRSCDVFVGNGVFGDPSYGCAKDFVAKYKCTGEIGTHSASHGPVVNENYSVGLSCQ